MALSLKVLLVGGSAVAGIAGTATIVTKSFLNSSESKVVTTSEGLMGQRQNTEDNFPATGEQSAEESQKPQIKDASSRTETSASGAQPKEEKKVEAHSPFPTKVSKLSEAEEYKNRVNNPALCKVVLASTSEKTKVEVCRNSQGGADLEFMYHTNLFSMPIRVRDLEFTYNHLVVNLTKSDNYGSTNKRMLLSEFEDIIAGKSVIPLQSVKGKKFTDKHCKATGNLEINSKDWTVQCQVT
ncbi:hypothetical protein OVS_04180 [Mycoplasma ovis str. Michigan]|uniref:Uncharacterized protein n=1 Tax=Mycoplasma ovis str. Michigan TaxID=1415773 RepID=A0ABM5P276_9MOLU|nr:hypothetical protein [Mycoplasma ovis]AHC40563.1 hypothetical protein OVS_04180 [Mycoplasma ovis str. Michigan]